MYEINENTIAVCYYDDFNTKIYELNGEFLVSSSVIDIINNSCRYYGSSYLGRVSGTKKILGISYKAPIVVEESDDIVFFPTSSPRLKDCSWFSLKKIYDYRKNGALTEIVLCNNKKIGIDISYSSFDNQVLRAARLQMLIKNRKIRKNYGTGTI